MRIHFIGIGGVSSQALAKHLLKKGFEVSGSDIKASRMTDELLLAGAKISYGHNEEYCHNKDIVIYNSAISEDNPELKFAKDNNIPLFDRADLLNLVAKSFSKSVGISGSHGKTTVTSLLCHIFDYANLPFTAHIGGLDSVYGNYYCNGNEYFLSEICEFNHNINKFSADTAVCLNIDNDHMDCYSSLDELSRTFFDYLDKGRTRIINFEDERLAKYRKDSISFGLLSGDYHIKDYCIKDGLCNFTLVGFERDLCEIKMKPTENYYLKNVLAAIATAKTIGISTDAIISGITNFKGVKRRNEYIGNLKGCRVIADYCHHPTEIKCFLRGKTRGSENVFIVFQPHTYSRTKQLLSDFVSVFSSYANLYIYKTFAAREDYDYYGSAEYLSQFLPRSKYFDDFNNLFEYLSTQVKRDSIVYVLGAGDIYDLVSDRLKKEP